MKISIWLLFILCALAACQKGASVLPDIAKSATTDVAAIQPDTIPNKAAFRIKLVKDSISADETLLKFNSTSAPGYIWNEDVAYLQGFGQVSLASISQDGLDLSINDLPYRSGMVIGLDVHAKANGTYALQISYENSIPANIQIWVKDTYLKDSVNMRTKTCTFNINQADTSSFGPNRFKLTIKDSGQHQTAELH